MANHIDGEGVDLIIERYISKFSLPFLDVLLPKGIGLFSKRGDCILLLDLIDEVIIG
jgi:hypothetical protein